MDGGEKNAEETIAAFSADVMTEILSRLPVKTLLTCKIVCKSWYSVISSTGLIRMHLNRSYNARYNQHKTLMGIQIPHWGDDSPFVLFKENSDGVMLAKEFDFPAQNLVDPENGIIPKVQNSCDGLICFQMERASTVVVWNPCLPTEYKVIDTLSNMDVCAIGYDPCTDDYKIVGVPHYSFDECHSVQLFSLKTETWKTLRITKTRDFFVESTNMIYSKNCLHWLNEEYRGMHYEDYDYDGSCELSFLVYFDLAEESLGYLNVPSLSTEFVVVPMNYKDSLAVAIGSHRGEKEFWVLQDYCGMKSSWTKILRISFSDLPFMNRYCFTSKGELVISNENGLAIADERDGSLKDFVYEGHTISYLDDDYHQLIFTFPYVESLVLPRRLQ